MVHDLKFFKTKSKAHPTFNSYLQAIKIINKLKIMNSYR